MDIAIAIIEVITLLCAVFLSLATPIFLIAGWARVLATYIKASIWAWFAICGLLFISTTLTFIVSQYILRGGITDASATDYWHFNYHPLWWMLSLLGLVALMLSPDQKQMVRVAIGLAALLYIGILLSSPASLQTQSVASTAAPTDGLGLLAWGFSFYANSFVTLAFVITSVFRPIKKVCAWMLAISLGFSLFCMFLITVFPLPVD